MCHKQHTKQDTHLSTKQDTHLSAMKTQQGNLLVATLVIIVLILTLGLALSRVLSGAANQNVVEYYGARAFLAAQSGLETGLSALFPLNDEAQSCAVVPTQVSFNTRYLQFCEVTIRCQEYIGLADSSSHNGEVNIYYLQSSAQCASNNCAVGGPCRKDYWQTQRTVSVEAKTLP